MIYLENIDCTKFSAFFIDVSSRIDCYIVIDAEG